MPMLQIQSKKAASIFFSACLTAASVALLPLPAQAALPEFADIVERTSPAVVNISATSKAKPAETSNDDMQELLRRFYGLEAQPQQPRAKQSFGSGFIIGNDGYVLTNNHVIDEADKVTVRLSDRREVEATVIGTDPRSDIALLKIAATDLPVVKIGDPSKLRVGDAVLAIGSPFGFDYSATAGIVSAKARALPNEAYVPFIQTDVAINPGNSGGPLFNTAGEVVGINSQIYSRSGGFMGVSFAIPIDVAMEVVAQLRDKGKVNRGYLGVSIQEVTKELADAYGLERPAGALIANVEAGSPADKAGLKSGDVVIQFNGLPITMAAELPQAIGRAKVGEIYPLSVVRERKPMQLQVKVQPIPEEQTAAAGKAASPDLSRLGVTLRDLQEAEKASLKLAGGALVIKVVEGSGADAGLRAGDVVTRLGSTAITSARDFVAAARKLNAGVTVPVSVLRRGSSLILALKLEPQDASR
ncbi:MAG: DegQ family serine endoprotease [Pseudomonadota bacterium]